MKFRDSVLKASVGVLDFVWYCFLPIGRSGGVVVGVNSSTVNIKDITRGDRCVKFKINRMVLNGVWLRYIVLLEMHRKLVFLQSLYGYVMIQHSRCQLGRF
jgi:hypothetical protein